VRKARIYVLLIAVVAVPGLMGLVFSQEPAARGRTLSEWLVLLDGAQDPKNPACEAILEMGSDTVPYLLKWSRYEMPPWKRRLYKLVNPITRHFEKPSSAAEKKARAQAAMLGLIVLGPKAESAVPQLSKMLRETNDLTIARFAPMALSRIGTAGLPPLVAALTNQQTTSLMRCYVMSHLGMMGTNAAPCIPALERALEDSNWNVRTFATNLLRRIRPPRSDEFAER